MVDFDNEAIFSADKYHINNLLSVQRHAFVIDALEKYDKLKFQTGSKAPSHVVRASINALFRQVRSNFIRTDKEKCEAVNELLKSNDFEKTMEAFYMIDDWLAEKGATLFIRIRNYDITNPFEVDEARGLG